MVTNKPLKLEELYEPFAYSVPDIDFRVLHPAIGKLRTGNTMVIRTVFYQLGRNEPFLSVLFKRTSFADADNPLAYELFAPSVTIGLRFSDCVYGNTPNSTDTGVHILNDLANSDAIYKGTKKIHTHEAGWFPEDLRAVAELMGRWNGHQAHYYCPHQEAMQALGFRQDICTNRCPVCGFNSTSDWYFEPVPPEVLRQLDHLPGKRHDQVHNLHLTNWLLEAMQ